MIRKYLAQTYIFAPRGHSYAQKQAHPSTAKKGNMDPEAVFPLDSQQTGKNSQL